MRAPTAHISVARLKTIGFWLLKILLAALFLFTGVAKLAGLPAVVDVFERVGFGQWFRYFTALLELGGAALLLWPSTTVFGALLLTIVSVGAFLAQLLILHEDIIHTIVMTLVLGAIVWTHRDQLRMPRR
ncbi:MAG: DoxX family protein [Methyloceanibacter sp.]